MSGIESDAAKAPRDLCGMVTVDNVQIGPNFDYHVVMEPVKGQILVAIAGEHTSYAAVCVMDFRVSLPYNGFRNECFDTHWCMHNFAPVNVVSETRC